jgi:H+-transporting ATPase
VAAATPVSGDLVKLSRGAVVAADVNLIDGAILVDQSMLADVIATGARTKFGRTAELVRCAKVAPERIYTVSNSGRLE